VSQQQVSFSTIYGVLKTSKACVIMLINVTFAPTPIFGIANGTSLGVTSSSNSSIEVLTNTIDISINFVGKEKIQETMVNFVPLLIGYGSSMVMTTGSL